MANPIASTSATRAFGLDRKILTLAAVVSALLLPSLRSRQQRSASPSPAREVAA